MIGRFVRSTRTLFVAIAVCAMWAAPALAQTGAAVRPARQSPGMTARSVQVTMQEQPSFQPFPESAPMPVAQGTNGLSLVGSVGFQISGSTVRLTADEVLNSSLTRTSGTLRLNLWVSSSTYGGLGYSVATYTMGVLPPNTYFGPIDQTVSFSAPPAGCYYVTLYLEEFQSSGQYAYVDFVNMTCSNNCDATGNRINFNGGCNSVLTCTPDSRTACLLNNRFKATVRYRGAFDNAAADTDALVKPVTGFASSSFETAFFYFNSSNNIEMLLKMLDQGNTNSSGQPTIALLFGSATPLRIELTITDMQTGAVKRYTGNFAQQAGQTDFTAFVK